MLSLWIDMVGVFAGNITRVFLLRMGSVLAGRLAGFSHRVQIRSGEKFSEISWNWGTSCSIWDDRRPHRFRGTEEHPVPSGMTGGHIVFYCGRWSGSLPYLREILSCKLSITVSFVSLVTSTFP